jgi:hypothetical protein
LRHRGTFVPEKLAARRAYRERGLVAKLERVVASEFVRSDYSGAIKVLERAHKKFEFLVKWASTYRGGPDDLSLLLNGRTGEVVWPLAWR